METHRICIVCLSTSNLRGYTLIPRAEKLHMKHYCSMKCLEKYVMSSRGEKIHMERNIEKRFELSGHVDGAMKFGNLGTHIRKREKKQEEREKKQEEIDAMVKEFEVGL